MHKITILKIFVLSTFLFNCNKNNYYDDYPLNQYRINSSAFKEKAIENISRMDKKKYFKNKKERFLANAIEMGNLLKIKQIIEQDINVNSYGKDSITFLNWALLKQQKKSYHCLLENGADPNQIMKDGFSIVAFVVLLEDSSWLHLALEYGGDPDTYYPNNDILVVSKAVLMRRIKNLKLLIEYGADLNTLKEFECSPLFTAISINQFNVALLLLKSGADPTVNKFKAIRILKDMNNLNSKGNEKRQRIYDLLKEKKGIDIDTIKVIR